MWRICTNPNALHKYQVPIFNQGEWILLEERLETSSTYCSNFPIIIALFTAEDNGFSGLYQALFYLTASLMTDSALLDLQDQSQWKKVMFVLQYPASLRGGCSCRFKIAEPIKDSSGHIHWSKWLCFVKEPSCWYVSVKCITCFIHHGFKCSPKGLHCQKKKKKIEAP